MAHSLESYKDASGEWRWRIKANGNIVADSGEGYKNEKDALTSLFGIYFAEYDESFLDVYTRWQQYAGVEDAEDSYVRIASPVVTGPVDADAPNYEAYQGDSAPDVKVVVDPNVPRGEPYFIDANFTGNGGGLAHEDAEDGLTREDSDEFC
jgi:uncharacterized protein YegP (UPF0339 family)